MNNINEKYDVAVLGGGPGGYTAGIRASQLGLKTCVIEKDRLGGTCLNRGCIPTKAFYSNAEQIKKIKYALNYGIKVPSFEIDWQLMLKNKNDIVNKLTQGISFLLKKNNVDHIQGRGTLTAIDKISVEKGGQITDMLAKNIILATGSEPANIPSFNMDGRNIMNSTDILNMSHLPKSLIIVGGGVVGCEFASIFAEMGVEITVVDILPTLLGVTSLDDQIIRLLNSSFKKRGIKIVTGVHVKEIKATEEGNVSVYLESNQVMTAQKVLVSVGRKLNTEGIGLREIGVELGEKGEVIVNDSNYKTNIDNIYAIGDITNKWQLAHVASHQGLLAVESIANNGKPFSNIDYNKVPSCIFTHPPIAYIGISERKARENGYDAAVGKFPYIASGKAMSEGETEGMLKVIIDKNTKHILGAHIFGANATEMIHEFSIAMRNNLTLEEVINSVHAHPTFSEMIPEACENAFDLSINI